MSDQENFDKKMYQQFNYAKKKRALQHTIIKTIEKLPALWNEEKGKIRSPIASRALYVSMVKEINKELGTRFKCNKNKVFFDCTHFLLFSKIKITSAVNKLDTKKFDI